MTSHDRDTKVARAFTAMKRLPREIRDQIYLELLGESKDVHATTAASITDFSIQRPSILGVCNQIRNEAKPVYDSNRSYRFTISDDESWKAPFRWLETLSVAQEAQVEDLTVRFHRSGRTLLQSWEMLMDFKACVSDLETDSVVSTYEMRTALWNLRLTKKLRLKHEAMMLQHYAGTFDLSKLTLEASESDHLFKLLDGKWRDLLQESRIATVQGRVLEFLTPSSARRETYEQGIGNFEGVRDFGTE